MVLKLSLKASTLFRKHTPPSSLTRDLFSIEEKNLIEHWFAAGHVSNTGFWFWKSDD